MMFWKILLAHALTDFVLQPGVVALNKGKARNLVLHASVFFILSNLSLLPLFSWRSVLSLGLLSLSHGVIDFLKYHIEKRYEKDPWMIFLADQALHLLGIAAVVLLLETSTWALLVDALTATWTDRSVFLVSSFFILIIFGGSYFIGAFCRGFLAPSDSKGKPGIDRAGRYLGMVERSLVLAAVLVGKIEFIGYIFAAKSIARYPEMKEESQFAEYYLIGTLTSISIAFFGGLLLKALLGW